MITEKWQKFKSWVVLEYFLKTSGEIHIKELTRKLNINSQTASYYLKYYTKENVLEEKRKGNLLLYSLSDNCLTRQLKVFYMIF